MLFFFSPCSYQRQSQPTPSISELLRLSETKRVIEQLTVPPIRRENRLRRNGGGVTEACFRSCLERNAGYSQEQTDCGCRLMESQSGPTRVFLSRSADKAFQCIPKN